MMQPPRINNNHLQGIQKDMLNILEAYRDVNKIKKRDLNQENELLNSVTKSNQTTQVESLSMIFFSI